MFLSYDDEGDSEILVHAEREDSEPLSHAEREAAADSEILVHAAHKEDAHRAREGDNDEEMWGMMLAVPKTLGAQVPFDFPSGPHRSIAPLLLSYALISYRVVF